MLENLYRNIGYYFLRKSERNERDHHIEKQMIECCDEDYDEHPTPDMEPTYNIRVYSANGGRVIECYSRSYNTGASPKTNSIVGSSNSQTRLYVIPDGADLQTELGKILMIDSLSN